MHVMGDDRLPADGTRKPAHTTTIGPAGDREPEHAARGPAVADGGLQINEVIDALADERRRSVLYYLKDRENADLEEVTEHVATRETEIAADELDERTMMNTRIELYHAHLPKLEAAGIIGYDRRQGSVRLQYLPAPVERFLEYCETVESGVR